MDETTGEETKMADSESKNNGGFLSGIIFGGVVGFLAGMAIAPKSGDETRTLFSETGQELRDKADEFIAAAKERIFAGTERGGRKNVRDFPFDDLDLDDVDL